MMKVNNYVCPECGKIFKTLGGWSSHVEREHPEIIPEGWSLPRFFYYLQTGKKEGTCIICKRPTEWNESSMKYKRFCEDPECKVKYRKMFEKRNLDKYGYVHKLNDPEVQRKMLAARKISGSYTFKNSEGTVNYVGKDELAFLEMLDLLEWPANDIMGPSPHTYEYNYKNPKDKEHEGKHFYIPDYYIPSINCEIEIKDTSNNHHKIRDIDNVKDQCKRKAMEGNSIVNYVFIDRKNFEPFYELLFEIKRTFLTKEIDDKSIGRNSRLASNLAANESYINEFAEDNPVEEDWKLVSAMEVDLDTFDEVRTDDEERPQFRRDHHKQSRFKRKRSKMVTLYHGSENDYPYLLAMGMDFGNLLQKPGWSLFVSPDKSFTYKWALFRAIRMARKNNNRLEANIIWNPKLKTYSITEKTFEAMKDLFDNGKIEAYVYTINVPRDIVGIGNDSQHDERTIRTSEKINYQLKERIVVTEEIAREHGHVVTENQFYAEERYYRKKPLVFNRGVSSLLMTRDYSYQNKENKAALNAIFSALNDGSLRPGDDIEKFLKSKGLKIKSIGLLKRLLLAAGFESVDINYMGMENDPIIAMEESEMRECFPEDDESVYVLEIESYDPTMEANLTSTIENCATENMLISTSDKKYNVDLWGKTKDKNILWITGYSGSGKTSLAIDIDTKENDTVVISLDDFFGKGFIPHMGKIKERYDFIYKRIRPELNHILMYDGKMGEPLFDAYDKLIAKIIQCAKEDYGIRRYIIEGVQIYDFIPYDMISGQPLIIKGTSKLTSSVRSAYRDKQTLMDGLKKAFNQRNTVKQLNQLKENANRS